MIKDYYSQDELKDYNDMCDYDIMSWDNFNDVLYYEETGLPYVALWLNRFGFGGTPVVIVSPPVYYPDIIPVTISETPKILMPNYLFQVKNKFSTELWNAIFEFISDNCDLLLAHWNGTLEDDLEILHLIKKSQYMGYDDIDGQISLFADEE